MSNKGIRFMAQIAIPNNFRDDLLRTYKPMHTQVYCKHITLAYDVSRAYQLPDGPCEVHVIGRFRNSRVDALLVSVDGKVQRPDGRPFHITLSVAPGVAPAEAGLFNPGEAVWFDQGEAFHASAVLKPLHVVKSEHRNSVLKRVA